MRPPVTHALQRGRGCRNPPLSEGGGTNRGGHGGTWPVDMGIGGVFLCC